MRAFSWQRVLFVFFLGGACFQEPEAAEPRSQRDRDLQNATCTQAKTPIDVSLMQKEAVLGRMQQEEKVEASEPQPSKAPPSNPPAAGGAKPATTLASSPGATTEPARRLPTEETWKKAAPNAPGPSERAADTESIVEHETDFTEMVAKELILPVTAMFIAAFVVANLLEKLEISWLPESASVILLGVLLGLIMKSSPQLSKVQFFTDDSFHHIAISTLLNFFLLPMIIFESGWSLRVKDFASQFSYIMLFAVVGSLISWLTVGSLIYATGDMHGIRMPRTAFAFASLISATDPVATMSTYSSLRVDPLLNILVFGESTFNDAIAIVLFEVMNSDAIMGTPESRPPMKKLAMDITKGATTILAGSFAIGLGLAVVYTLILRFADMRKNPKLEILFLFMSSYLTFAIGDVVGMSGIISTIFCSVFLGIYARPHLSMGGNLLGTFFIKQMASMMDTAVFLLLGVCSIDLSRSGWILGLWIFLFCLVGRAAATLSMGGLSNVWKSWHGRANGLSTANCHLISTKMLFMIWHAGLRGAIALVLCMQLGPWVDVLDGPGTKHQLQTATFAVIILFLFAFGGSTEYFLKKFNIPMGKDSDPEKLYRTEESGWMKALIRWLNDSVLEPILVGDARLAASFTEDKKDLDVLEVLQGSLAQHAVKY